MGQNGPCWMPMVRLSKGHGIFAWVGLFWVLPRKTVPSLPFVNPTFLLNNVYYD